MQLSYKKIAFCAILPAIGILWQSYHITDAYMRYNSVTEITQLRQDLLNVPVLVFCIHALSSGLNFKIGKTLNIIDYPTPKSQINRLADLIDLLTFNKKLNKSSLEFNKF